MRCEICDKKIFTEGSKISIVDGKIVWYVCSEKCKAEMLEEIDFAENSSRDDNHLDFL